MATYNSALDKVMTKLRESAVIALTDDYVLMVGEWMNTIKEEIEDSWDWQAGRQSVSFSSTASTREYDLGIDPRSRLIETRPVRRPLMFDVTDSNQGFRLIQIPDDRRREDSLRFDTQSSDKPMHFSLYKTADTLKLAFKVLPEGVRDYTGVFYVPADPLDSLSDTFHIPERALVLGTLWLAAMERGEELGLNSDVLFRMYQDRLAKDIAMDMGPQDALAVAE